MRELLVRREIETKALKGTEAKGTQLMGAQVFGWRIVDFKRWLKFYTDNMVNSLCCLI